MRREAIAVTAAWLAAAALSAQEPTLFRTGTDLVHFGVTVTDRRGTVVTDLTAEDFEILENGTRQTLAQFARSGDEGAPDLHVGLLLDTSESMLADLKMSQTAAISFLSRVPEAEDLTLVEVGDEVHASRFGQDDFPRLVERIRSIEPDGYTALYDGFAMYLEGAGRTGGRTVLVAFTDGGDSRSALDFGDLETIVRESAATIHVVGLIEHAPADVRNLQRLRLMRIADESGGRAIFPTSMRQIEQAYDRILGEMRAQYSLGYVSSDPRRDGRWREVKVRIRNPDRRDLRVRARPGYVASRDAP